MEEKNYKWIACVVAVFLALMVVLILNPFIIISTGERGVVMNFGKIVRVLPEGIHWVTPISESVDIFDVKMLKEQVDAASASKDLQTVSSKIALNYHLNPDKVGDIRSKIGSEDVVKTTVIDPAIQESVKASMSKYTAEELITKRSEVKDNIKLSLTDRLSVDYIVVDEVSITDFDFSESFNQSIEAKVTAEQDALAAKNKLEQVKFEAEQRIAQAKGEAEAIKIQSQAIESQGGAAYVQLQAIRQWKGEVPQYMMGNSVPFINLGK